MASESVREAAEEWLQSFPLRFRPSQVTLIGMKSVFVAALLICSAWIRGCHRSESLKVPNQSLRTARPQTRWQMFGERWLLMSPDEKELYVSAYVAGTVSGQHDLCNAERSQIGDFMNAHKVKHLLYPGNCEELIGHYSHLETVRIPWSAAVYVKVLDDFYRHPECRMIPYFLLLEHLDDKEFVDGNTLFQNVRAGKVNLGFLEIEGVENCYGFQRKPSAN